MQRLSSTALAIALTIFVTAFSLALIAAAYFMVTYCLSGFPLVLLPIK